MPLPDDFIFSQSNLQDFTDCRRRFQLRYLDRIDWPALEAEPAHEHERHMNQGLVFHRMAHQTTLAGVDSEHLGHMAQDEDLRRWWHNFMTSTPYDMPGLRFPELYLSAPLVQWRVVAKIDLLVLSPEGKITILDWKTSQRRPPRSWVEGRLQTHVYRYIVTASAAGLIDAGEINPERVEMVYWYAGFPDNPERFSYSKDQYDRDFVELTAQAEQIDQLEPDAFDKTPNQRHCRFCPYRSLCDRGDTAGQLADLHQDFDDKMDIDFDLGFEQIAEIEF
jgi:CRISPR/Cas system-associated exonuclease Cas4 (RecB family)